MPNTILRITSLTLIIIFYTTAIGCADFDRQDRIEDTRILAVRTIPAEVKFSPLYSLLPPNDRPPGFRLPSPGPMSVEVFAYDPRGGLLISTTQMCPNNAPDSSCLNNYNPTEFLANFTPEQRALLAPIYTPKTVEQRLDDDDLLKDPTGRLKNLGFTFDFNDTVIDSIVQGNLSVFPLYPRIVVHIENSSLLSDSENPQPSTKAVKERAFKRIPVSMNLADPTLPPDIRDTLYGFLGFPACENPIEQDNIRDGEDANCLYALDANQNPTLLGFNLLNESKEAIYDPQNPQIPIMTFGGPTTLGPSSVISAPGNGIVRLDPVFPENVAEPYQVFGFDLETESLTLANRYEDIVISWYTTGGDVSRSISTVLLHLTMGVEWNLPSTEEGSNFKAGDRVTLIAVVRDQRGGVAIGQIIVELR